MNKKIIFHVEHRGHDYIFHWYSYMLAGLRHLPNNQNRFGPGGGGPIEKNYTGEQLNPTKPYNIYCSAINELNSYQKESLEILSDLFVYINKDQIKETDIIVNNYGEFIPNYQTHIHPDAYRFLRSIFLDRVSIVDEKYKGKKYYLSRSKSHLLEGNAGLKRRHMLNDEEFILYLKNKEIETVFLEDLPTKEKIKLFNQADMIISPNSGGLIFSLFASNTTKIVELNVQNPHQISTQYQNQCDSLNIPYYKFICNRVDDKDNMTIDIINFDNFLKSVG